MRIEDILCIGVFLAYSSFIFALDGLNFSFFDSVFPVLRYISFSLPKSLGFYIFLLLCVVVFSLTFILLTSFLSKKFLKGNLITYNKDTMRKTASVFLHFFILACITFLPSMAFITKASILFQQNAADILFWKMDQTVLGFQPFLTLPEIIGNFWATEILWTMYASLLYVAIFLFFYFFFVSREYLFRILFIALILGFYLPTPFFINFPCLDPGNYFFDNIHQNEIPTEIQGTISQYPKDEALAGKYISDLQKSERNYCGSGDPVVPISCFPSMHAIWGYICALILFMYNRRTLALSSTWLVLMLTGGVFFAQHYFIDYVVAIPFAVLSVALGKWLVDRDIKTS